MDLTQQFNHLRADHKVEAFVPIVSSDAAGSVFPHGGTPLGQMYMDILKAKYECWKKFHIWVTGMTVDAELNPWPDHLRIFLSVQLRLGRPRSRGWPAKARSIFQELKLVLTIQPDDVDPKKADSGSGNNSSQSRHQQILEGKIHVVLKAFHFNGILLSSAIGKGKADSSEVCGPQQLTNSSKANTPDDTGNAGSAHLVA
ncbi:hypothetical protein PSTT_14728 [Puccinia striiformis]|uniref:Uncharacterized protein n=1 Tax=Puccinia striiformis TaxID=27350 RepID=A0A2S4UL06_9BASI|nr:hypothetical protein PSTT_14728 [Puccinia striiformis]